DPAAPTMSTPVGTTGSGTNAASYSDADGTGTAVKFRSVTAATIDRAGAFIYFADETTLRRLDVASSTVTTVAGTFDTGALYTSRINEITARLPFWSMELAMDGT